MRIMSRGFSASEKALLALLAILLLGIAYYRFVDQPVRNDLVLAEAEHDALSAELTAVEQRVEHLRQMQKELDDMDSSSSRLPSYNASEEEIALLNTVLGAADRYSVTFSDVTRSGDLIRRNFSLQFTVDSFARARTILSNLSDSPYRCLLGEVHYFTADNGVIHVNATATFYETMIGGTPDAGLPSELPAEG